MLPENKLILNWNYVFSATSNLCRLVQLLWLARGRRCELGYTDWQAHDVHPAQLKSNMGIRRGKEI